jgi:hypothetical protein
MFMCSNRGGKGSVNEGDNFNYLASELSALEMARSYTQCFFELAKNKAITLPSEFIICA